MEPVREIVARAVPLDRSDVDTDQIIPSDWLKRVERTGFGEGLFSEWRESSDFVLNQDQFDGAQILVAGPNFGTGSSREHAPWALEDYGFRAVISPRFADIFRNNCLKIGLLPVELPAEVVTRIMRAVEDDPTIEIVDRRRRPARRGARDRPRRAVRARATSTTTACSKASTTSASPSATRPRSPPSNPTAPPTPPVWSPNPEPDRAPPGCVTRAHHVVPDPLNLARKCVSHADG